jgi:hypothetical protein
MQFINKTPKGGICQFFVLSCGSTCLVYRQQPITVTRQDGCNKPTNMERRGKMFTFVLHSGENPAFRSRF